MTPSWLLSKSFKAAKPSDACSPLLSRVEEPNNSLPSSTIWLPFRSSTNRPSLLLIQPVLMGCPWANKSNWTPASIDNVLMPSLFRSKTIGVAEPTIETLAPNALIWVAVNAWTCILVSELKAFVVMLEICLVDKLIIWLDVKDFSWLVESKFKFLDERPVIWALLRYVINCVVSDVISSSLNAPIPVTESEAIWLLLSDKRSVVSRFETCWVLRLAICKLVRAWNCTVVSAFRLAVFSIEICDGVKDANWVVSRAPICAVLK